MRLLTDFLSTVVPTAFYPLHCFQQMKAVLQNNWYKSNGFQWFLPCCARNQKCFMFQNYVSCLRTLRLGLILHPKLCGWGLSDGVPPSLGLDLLSQTLELHFQTFIAGCVDNLDPLIPLILTRSLELVCMILSFIHLKTNQSLYKIGRWIYSWTLISHW